MSELPVNDPRIEELLRVHTLTLATCSPEGRPHAAPVYFAASSRGLQPGMRLYFFSGQDSRHTQDLLRQPAAAGAIYPECEGWQDIRGLQLEGEVLPVERGPEWDAAWEQYRAKFPFVSALKVVVARNALFAFVPHWIRLVDNRRGFGFKQEWHFS